MSGAAEGKPVLLDCISYTGNIRLGSGKFQGKIFQVILHCTELENLYYSASLHPDEQILVMTFYNKMLVIVVAEKLRHIVCRWELYPNCVLF
jgi:hypothetical protein